jgi:type IV fimbrial biogenesis protein FimT
MLNRQTSRGMTLIELIVGITILAFVLASGAPSLMVWIRNAQIRGAAESVLNGLHHARAEAVKRNSTVRFQLTSTLDNSCAASATGSNWVINLGATTPTDGQCDAAASETTAPFLLTKAVAASSTGIAIQATSGQTAIAFDGFGRQATTSSTSNTVALYTITIQPSGGQCLASDGSGTYRCLAIQVTAAGLPRLCDPSIAGSPATNPTACLS